MGWLVEHLLKNKIEIKSKALDFSEDVSNRISHLETDEQYNDLIIVEMAVEVLYLEGSLSDFDMKIISYLSDGKYIINSEKYFGLSRGTITKHFQNICQRISYFLGGYFTDEGFIYEVATKNDLTEEQIDTLKRYIKSKYRHSVVRSIK